MNELIAPPTSANEQFKGRLEYWKQIVAVQMHFNDMCIRLRWLCLTGGATLIAAAAVTAKDHTRFIIPVVSEINVSTALLSISLLIVILMWSLDRLYYYRMLIASVICAEDMENLILPVLEIEGKGITGSISKAIDRRISSRLVLLYYVTIAGVVALLLLASFFIEPASGQAVPRPS